MTIKLEFDYYGLNAELRLRAEDADGKPLEEVKQPIERLAGHDPLCRTSMGLAVAATLQLLKGVSKELGWARVLSHPNRIEWEPAPTTQPETRKPQRK